MMTACVTKSLATALLIIIVQVHAQDHKKTKRVKISSAVKQNYEGIQRLKSQVKSIQTQQQEWSKFQIIPRLEENENTVADLNTQVPVLERSIQILQSDNDRLDKRNDKLHQQNEDFLSRLELLETGYQQLTKTNKNQEKTISSLHELVKKVTDKHVILQKDFEEKELKLSELVSKSETSSGPTRTPVAVGLIREQTESLAARVGKLENDVQETQLSITESADTMQSAMLEIFKNATGELSTRIEDLETDADFDGLDEGAGGVSNSSTFDKAELMTTFPILSTVTVEWYTAVSKAINDTSTNMADLQMNIIPSIETQLNAAQKERNVAQTDLADLDTTIKQLNLTWSAKLESLPMSMPGQVKEFAAPVDVTVDNSSSILDTVMNVRAKLSEAITTVIEQNSGLRETMTEQTASIARIDQATQVLHDNVDSVTTRLSDLRQDFSDYRLLNNQDISIDVKELNTPVASGDAIDGIQILETSDELMANDEADKQPLSVRALSLSILNEKVTGIKDRIDKMNATVSTYQGQLFSFSDDMKVHSNANRIANLTDYFTNKFEELSNSVDLRLTSQGVDYQGIVPRASHCDAVSDMFNMTSEESCAKKKGCIGFTGPNCTIDVNECMWSPCQHQGYCVNKPGSYECVCPPQWTGDNCETDVNECQVFHPCGNLDQGAVCENTDGGYACDCSSGYTGEQCAEYKDECSENSAMCGEGGVCVNTYPGTQCICIDNYRMNKLSGLCEYYDPDRPEDACDSRPCGSNGDCVLVDGDASSYVCTCHVGWSGENCDVDVDECEGNRTICTLPQRGTCMNTPGSFTCECHTAYSGTHCEHTLLRLMFPGRSRPQRRYGRIEIRKSEDAEWGTICDDGWSMAHGKLACNMLGYTDVFRHLRRGWVGQGQVLVRNAECTWATAKSLLECTWPEENHCTHSEDVGIVCSKHRIKTLL